MRSSPSSLMSPGICREGPFRLALAITMLAVAAFLAACTGEQPSRPVPAPPPAAPTPEPRPVALPADEAKHGDGLEWWYYHGHLNSPETGEEFGFHFVIFQAQTPGGVPLYASQLGLTDVRQGTHVSTARVAVGGQATGNDMLELVIGGWSLSIDGAGHTVSAADGTSSGFGVDLRMTRPSTPMLHNETGWMGGPNGWTYYYSWPRMTAEGDVTVQGRKIGVTGEVWMDHQWGDFFVLGHPAGWQWFAIQLDDGSSLMLQEFRDIEGKSVSAFGTLLPPDGQPGSPGQTTLQPGAYTVEVLDYWRSPETGADYPSKWRVRVPSQGLDLEIEPVVAGQEITRGVPPAAIYWEGKSSVTGTKDGQPVAGRAYVELTGYVDAPGPKWMSGTGGKSKGN